MLNKALHIVLYGILLGSLMLFDYLLGNGFLDKIQRQFCKIFCFVKKTVRDQAKTSQVAEPNDINFLMLILEVLGLCCTMLVLNKYKKYNMDRLRELEDDSKETKELMEKMKLRRRSKEIVELDSADQPQLIKPLNLEVPVLHMAIIDTLATTRSQPERGDAGDICNITDSAVLSVTSLFDKDFQLPESLSDDCLDVDGNNTVQFNNNRYLWDVIEED